MIFLFGIRPEIKPQNHVVSGVCPACGSRAPLRLIYKYMTAHAFFIPVFRFHREYVAVCGSCASVMALSAEKGRKIAKNPGARVAAGDFTILKNNAVKK